MGAVIIVMFYGVIGRVNAFICVKHFAQCLAHIRHSKAIGYYQKVGEAFLS